LFLEDQPKEKVLGPLVLVSFVSLYLELMLIRWVGTEIRVFAYFQNLTLIACFLGFGVGCYRATAKKHFLFEAGTLALLVICVGLPFASWRSILEVLSAALAFSLDAQTWSESFTNGRSPLVLSVLSVLLITLLLSLVVQTMIPLGQWVGTYLNAAKNPVRAYSANLLGSLGGMWLFAGMSFLRLAPVFWFALAFLLFFLVHPRVVKFGFLRTALCAASLLLLGYAASSGLIRWSPYQKLELQPLPSGEYHLLVNNTGYMTLANVSPEHLAENTALADTYKSSSYDAPFRFVESRQRVLIVGAGAGNDADAALRNGASQVDAVEIDPVIYSLGRKLHPDHPYQSPKVRVIIDDARSFLRESRDSYDVIVFGLLDSHTEFSGYSNMRIDNYVYTEESLREAKGLLKPSGVLIVKFEVRPPWTWMGERFYSMFNDIFGRPPVVFYAPPAGRMLSATEFIASNDSGVWDRARQPALAGMILRNPPKFSLNLQQAPAPTTDDWPYVYNRGRTIPRTYFTVSAILLGLAILILRHAFKPAKACTWNFFFLGAGFLLLETQMISRLALYFGSTWLVNCVVISLLLSVLVGANVCVERGAGLSLELWYGATTASLLALYAIHWDALPLRPFVVGTLLAAGYCVPVFSAGVIFAETFRRSNERSTALGSNIVGAVVGGLAENVSFVFGLKSLLLLAGVFYLLGALFDVLAKQSPLPVPSPRAVQRAAPTTDSIV
jgi:spermidine synthase